MRLEYFLLIDRIVELKLDDHTIRTEATVPTTSTIFEGHFPAHPLMPGVLLIETMAQTSGWLLIAMHKFTRMPFFAAVKEAKLRTFVTPGQVLAVSAKLVHDGSGFAITKAEIKCEGKPVCNAELTFRLVEFPNPSFRASMEKVARRDRVPHGGSPWLRRARSGSPASASSRASARALDAHWQGLSAPSSADTSIVRALRGASRDRGRFRQADPEEGRPAPDGAVAALRRLCGRACARQRRRERQRRLLSKTDMIVAAGGGERDGKVDISILAGLREAKDRGAYLNQRLMSDLRPTLFLAQLSNLMAGNISIVHGVTGSSRTFMGEEQAGVDALRIALARITAGQSELALVGGAYNAERCEVILYYVLGEVPDARPAQPRMGARRDGGGMELGTLAAFLVLEEKSHALKRGAKPFARSDRHRVRSRQAQRRARSRPRWSACGPASRNALSRRTRP